MPTPRDLLLTMIRIVGILGAGWILFVIISTHFHLQDQPMWQWVRWAMYERFTAPLAILAVLFVLPSKKSTRDFALGCTILSTGMGAFLMFQFFGMLIWPGQNPLGIIGTIWKISLWVIPLVLLTQIVGVVLRSRAALPVTASLEE